MHIYRYIPVVLQFFGGLVVLGLIKTFTRLDISGVDHVKNIKGKVIFAANHISEWDGPLVRVCLPILWRNSPMYYVALSKEYYPKERFGWRSYVYGGIIFQLFGAYPIYKGLKDYAQSLRNHINILEEDGAVCMFPEGKMRKKDTQDIKIHGGVAYLAYKTKAPVIPVHIEGLKDLTIKKFLSGTSKVSVTYGKPITHAELFPDTPVQIDDFKKRAESIMKNFD